MGSEAGDLSLKNLVVIYDNHLFSMINFNDFLELLPLTALYAETHYRFRFFPFSRYFRREAEVVFDTPIRLEPGVSLPVSLIIKDSKKFPLRIINVHLQATSKGVTSEEKIPLNTDISSSFWYRIFNLDISSLPDGEVAVEATAEVSDGRHTWTVQQDNHPLLSHAPFNVYKSADPMPAFPEWSAGELHCHSEFGFDQVEFGAPLEVYQKSAPSMGIDWVAITDHSYNLDDMPDDYLTDDPMLRKWKKFLEKVETLNQTRVGALLIPGEELTCRSALGKNIHLLVLDNLEFLHGTGDGAQKWLHTRSENSVAEALSKITDSAFTAAAHPLVPINWLQRLLVRRGRWEDQDLRQDKLMGWQICNGMWDKGFYSGLKKWIEEINRGKRVYIFAGNDAHGNFNRFRQIKIPMWTMHENQDHLFGKVTTRVRSRGRVRKNEIIENMKDGKSYISDGPAIELSIIQNNKILFSGDTADSNSTGSVRVRYKSSPEFGQLHFLKILGDDQNRESLIRQYTPESDPFCKSFKGEILLPLTGSKYIRAEIETENSNGKRYKAFTNPIWISDVVSTHKLV